MSTIRFQQLALADFDAAYALVIASVMWLHNQRLPSWLMPKDVYYQRHADGDNYGLFDNDTLCAVVTLTTYHPNDWKQVISHQHFTWLATLASLRTQSRNQYGLRLMQFAEHHTLSEHKSAIYLDCYYGNGRLPQYYQQLGYE